MIGLVVREELRGRRKSVRKFPEDGGERDGGDVVPRATDRTN